jgi:hypothetical protein
VVGASRAEFPVDRNPNHHQVEGENLFGNLVVQVYRDSKPITMPVGIVCIDNKHPDLSKTKAILDIDHAATPGRTFRLNEMQQLLECFMK